MRSGLWCHLGCGLMVCGAIGLAGCSGGSAAVTTSAATAPASNTAAAPATGATDKAVEVPVAATPDQVVTAFLTALKTGDKATTASLLTAKAAEETTKHSIEVDPQAAPNAQYQVQAPEYLQNNPNGAHVTSVWTETYDDGNVNYEIVWVLRRQPQGWRIAGMALQLIPGQDPAFLNFEDPTDMLKKRDEAIAAMQPPAAETASQPAALSGSQPQDETLPPATRIER